MTPHRTRPVLVWADIDLGISDDVEYLNAIPEVRTFDSCQGSIGEGGPAPYRPYITAWWPESVNALIEARFEMGERGNGWSCLHPKA